MSPAGINARADREAIVFDTARQIRELLEAAREKFGPELWDEQAREDDVLQLVNEEDSP